MTNSEQSAQRPQRYWFILLMLMVFSIVTYLDRVNISVAAKYIMPEFGLSKIQMGTIFSALVFGYALFQIPGGWLGDRLGPRKVLTLAIVWWSVFTALTTIAGKGLLASITSSLTSFIIIRFLIGVGEGIAVPTYNRVIANWMAPTQRAFASSFVLSGMGIGGAVTPPLIASIMIRSGWRTSFFICAAVGIVVGIVWFKFTSDRPSISEADSNSVRGPLARQPVPWKAILTDSNVWLLTLSQIFAGYVASVFTYWFFLYLVDVRGFSLLGGSFYAMGPFIAAAVLPPFGGILSDRLVQRYGKRFGRRATAIGLMSLTAVFVVGGVRASGPYLAIAMLSLGAGLVFSAITTYWATVVDISRTFAGTITGITVMGANIGGTIAPTLTPLVAKHFGWTAALDCAALAALLAAVIWFGIRPERELTSDPTAPERTQVPVVSPGRL
jgi:MFS transporter, ACS family, glucarate transporter